MFVGTERFYEPEIYVYFVHANDDPISSSLFAYVSFFKVTAIGYYLQMVLFTMAQIIVLTTYIIFYRNYLI